MKIFYFFFYFIKRILSRFDAYISKLALGHCGKNVILEPLRCSHPQNIYLYDNTSLAGGFTFINVSGKFIMRENSGSAGNLRVITGNHHFIKGMTLRENFIHRLGDEENDIIVDENVWIGANVTLMDKCYIGRGTVIGAGSVVRTKIPPYAMVIGNPAKVVGFVFTPEEIIEHEKALYPEEKRLPFELLEKNYNKYFVNRIKEIKDFVRI